MGNYKKVLSSSTLRPGMIIREYDKQKEDYDYYKIASFKTNETYEVYPSGDDSISKQGVLLHYPHSKMVARNCEFYDED